MKRRKTKSFGDFLTSKVESNIEITFLQNCNVHLFADCFKKEHEEKICH